MLSLSDWIGSIGVAILLLAFLLNLLRKIAQNSLIYIIMNMVGAGLACLASVLLQFMPFIILEGAWTLVSAIALINLLRKSNTKSV